MQSFRFHHRTVLLALACASFLLCRAAACAETADLAVTVLDERGKPVADAVVVATPADGKAVPAAKPREEMIDQVDKEFTPKVKPVVVGTSVVFPNRDNVRHHVYSFSPAKRFEVPLYAGVPPQPIVFDKPGVVVLGCNIHDWMVGYVYVSESPYFAKTDSDGKAAIAGMAAQAYVVRVWHAQLDGAEEATRKTIDLGRTRHADAAWTVKLKSEVKVRRAPVAGHGSHY